MLFQEGLPPLRVVGNHKFRSQRQDHRHIVLLRVLNRLHGGFRHRLARLAAHQVGGEHQRRRARNHLFRNTLCTQLVHVAWADGEGSLTGFPDQRKAAANRAVDALEIVQVGTTGGVAQVTIGVATNFDVTAHHAEQHRAVVCQNGVVVHGIADGAAGKLMSDQIVTH